MASSSNAPIQLEISVRISQPNFGSGQIHLNETLELPQTDFLGLAAIMKKFHDLAMEITAASGKK